MTKKIIDGVVMDLTPEEEEAGSIARQNWIDGAFDRDIKFLRQQRNNLLAETDFYALSDVTMSSDMTDYRQALRDLPSGLDTVEKVNNKVYPTKP